MKAPEGYTRLPCYTRPPGVGNRSAFLQTAVRRPLSRLMTRTTNPTTRSKWINAPPMCRLKPRSHKIRRTTKMVQSMLTSSGHSRVPEYESHYVRVRARRTGHTRSIPTLASRVSKGLSNNAHPYCRRVGREEIYPVLFCRSSSVISGGNSDFT